MNYPINQIFLVFDPCLTSSCVVDRCRFEGGTEKSVFLANYPLVRDSQILPSLRRYCEKHAREFAYVHKINFLPVEVGPFNFKPTDLTLREMVEKYLNGFHSEFQTPTQQELARKIRVRLAGFK
jgi:hypothetical protein